MRTDSPSSTGATAARIRAELVRVRRRIVERAPAWSRQWRSRGLWLYALAGLGLAVVLAASALNSGPATPASGFVRAGCSFSNDDLISIARAFDGKNLPFHVDRRNRIEVAADRIEEANALLAKLDVGPRALPEIERSAADSSLWDTPGSKERRQEQARNDVLAAIIGKLDGLTGARVWINRPRGLPARRPPAATAPGQGSGGGGATALVYLETGDDREVDYVVVQSIVNLIARMEPDVPPNAVSVFDQQLRCYVDACNPSLGAEARDRARGEELAREIADKLSEINGVRVSVRLVPATPGPALDPASSAIDATTTINPGSALPPMPTSLPAAPLAASAPGIGPLPPLPDEPPAVGVNQPLALTAEPPPPALPPAPEAEPPRARDEANESPVASKPASTPAAPAMKAQVWVKVPRSFYLRATSKPAPSFDDVQPLVTRVESLIHTAVQHVVPADLLGKVSISTIPDELPAPPSPPLTASADARRAWPWWAPVLATAAIAAAGTVAALRFHAGRRPAPGARPTSRGERGRYKIDEASDASDGPGPSERVRELIRLNPEAAASVLHRWTGQGGPIV